MSASPARSPRSRRGRVLVVGDSAAASRLAALLLQPPASVANMFEAIGEIASSGTQDAVAAIVVSPQFTQPPHQCALSAVRRIDPSVRIIALAIGANDAATALPGGAIAPDAWLDSSFRADELRKAFDDDGLLAPGPGAEIFSTPPPQPAQPPPALLPAQQSPPDSIIASPATPVRNIIDLDAPVPQPPTPVPTLAPAPSPPQVVNPQPAGQTSTRESRTVEQPKASQNISPPTSATTPAASAAPVAPAAPRAPAPTPVSAIGDTDLIHALLHSTEGVTPLALRLIAHHGGWSNVRLIADEVAGESPHAHDSGVAVVCDGKRFGRLHAEGAEPGRLRAWADWLGYWLHIEREHHRLRHLANCDDLTGAWNRRFFDSFLTDAIARARIERRSVTVMVFDIDNFKTYNDTFGHAAGDEILREMVRLLRSVVRQGDIVCRIGGDEFVVVFADPEAPRTPGSKHPESVESVARRFQHAVTSMRFPKLGIEAHGSLSISAGLATFPWDGQDSDTLLRHADLLAMHSKRNGKNMITLGRGMGESTAR